MPSKNAKDKDLNKDFEESKLKDLKDPNIYCKFIMPWPPPSEDICFIHRPFNFFSFLDFL